MKHTKGEWETTIINNMVYIVSAHREIAIICVKPDAGHLYKPIEMEANARLIAAAPKTAEQRDDLLANLEMLVRLLCHPGSFVSAKDIDKAKAAIAEVKAEVNKK